MIFCLLSLSVILTLATTSHSLTCIECMDASDVPCTGPVKSCLPDEVCLSRYTLTSIAGVPISKLFIRGCGNRSQCSESGSASIPHANVLTASSCCFTNGCTPPRPTLPSTTSEKNGVMCKACQTIEESPCDSDTYIDCTGLETKCISQVTKTVGLPSSAMRGCATPSLCKIPHEEGTFGPLKFSSHTVCTDGGASLHYCLSLLAVTFLCLFKVMI
ncbi:phospholipase A2 inhibitor and Ly6/PLAUR domain-containing protein-like [Leptodactylus fuscus]|uniref:phospholipase A2 inhibitor and Ly6/PLAUR domain-containing protein-like n=1 Tax=Leptodactylus fuscus TaxID=238119 RepID=UPI003F4E9255